jgi:hypothetical protein
MQGQPNHGQTYYRCRFPTEYALTAELEHPKTVYVQEAPIVPALDGWLGQLFDHNHIDETCAAVGGGQRSRRTPGGAGRSRAPPARRL